MTKQNFLAVWADFVSDPTFVPAFADITAQLSSADAKLLAKLYVSTQNGESFEGSGATPSVPGQLRANFIRTAFPELSINQLLVSFGNLSRLGLITVRPTDTLDGFTLGQHPDSYDAKMTVFGILYVKTCGAPPRPN
jgi:hypothetical protein